MEEDIIEQRKEKLFSFLKGNKNYLQYILLALIIYLSIFIRSQNLEVLKDKTTGEYITAELDSTIYLKYAREAVETGKIQEIDYMRNHPVGAPPKVIGIFTSYFIAYLHKFLDIFFPTITIEYTDIIYPIISTVIMTIFLFLLVRRLFDWRVALLSSLFITVLPSFLFRSTGGSSDHDILTMMFIIMSFYFYIVAWQSKKTKNAVIFGLIAGLFTGITRLSGGAGNLILLVIGTFNVIEIFLNKFDKKDYFVLASWIVPVSMMIEYFKMGGGLVSATYALITTPAFLAFGMGTVDYFVFKKDFLKIKEKYAGKIPNGILTLIITGILGVLFLVVAGGGFSKISELGETVTNYAFKAYAETRWTLTVAENRKPYVTDWFGNMSKLYVYTFIIGSILLFYNAVKPFKKKIYLTALYAIFIIGYIFSRYSGSSVFNGDTGISDITFFGSIALFLIVIAYSYLKAYYKNKEEYEHISKIDKKYAFIFVWFIMMIFAATSAIRLLFEFSPVTTVLTSLLIISAYDYLKNHKEALVKYAGIAIILILLFNPFSVGKMGKGTIVNFYQNSLGMARSTYPGYNPQWQYAGEWVRENTPENAVFAHWWDYGYWVVEGFRRATMTDGNNLIGWWNYLMARNVLTTKDEKEAIKFLYAHNATNLLIIVDEIGKYPAYSSIGSDKNYDRYSWVNTISLDPSRSQEKRNETILFYNGGFALDESIIIDDVVLPAYSAGIGAILLPLEKQDNKTTVKQPVAVLVYNDKQYDIPLNCLFIEGKENRFDKPADKKGIDGCLQIIPVYQGDKINPMGAAIYLSPRVYGTLFAKLFLFGQDTEYLKNVYNDEKSIPLAIWNGRLVGPLKIWEINYPKNLKLTDEEYNYFLRKDYPDLELTLPR